MTTEQIEEKVNEMFKRIRGAEIRNEKIGKYDDRAMISQIEKYILAVAKQEIAEEENHEV